MAVTVIQYPYERKLRLALAEAHLKAAHMRTRAIYNHLVMETSDQVITSKLVHLLEVEASPDKVHAELARRYSLLPD